MSYAVKEAVTFALQPSSDYAGASLVAPIAKVVVRSEFHESAQILLSKGPSRLLTVDLLTSPLD